jgi:transcriptional repressor NrdR
VQLRELSVVKRNNRRVIFDRDKLARSVALACQKRNIDPDRVDQMVSGIVRRLESSGDSDVTSDAIGELVMDALKNLDPVAYVRYASVYKDFREADDFRDFIKGEQLGPAKDGKINPKK